MEKQTRILLFLNTFVDGLLFEVAEGFLYMFSQYFCLHIGW